MAKNPKEFQQLLEDLKNNTSNPRIQDGKVDLFLTGLDDTDIEELCKVLESNTTIEELNLSGNNIGTKGAKTLARTLGRKVGKGIEHIKTLKIYGNHIGSEGTEAIAKAFFKSEKIEELNLGGNNIFTNSTGSCNKGIKALGQLLLSNVSLTCLSLHDCDIPYKGINPIAESLSSNGSLQELNIEGNRSIGPEGVKKITETLKNNRNLSALEYIILGETCESDEQTEHKEAIKQLAEAKPKLKVDYLNINVILNNPDTKKKIDFYKLVQDDTPKRGNVAEKIAALKAKKLAALEAKKLAESQTPQPDTAQQGILRPHHRL